MARARETWLIPEFFTDETVTSLPVVSRLIFSGLMVLAESDGRVEYRPHRIWALLLPHDAEERHLMPARLAEMQSKGLIAIEGGWITIQRWKYWQAPAPNPMRVAWNALRAKVAPFIYARDGKRCSYCRTVDNLTIDHIEPIAAGGTNDLDNLQILCRPCNSKKGARVGLD